jgi:UDP-glucose 4-epimerase
VNIDGSFNVFRAASLAGVRRVVYAASSSAYGDTEVLPKTESMVPRPKSPYAVQKLLGEYYASVFHSCYGLETVALRFFNVYGPRQDPSSAYSGVLSLFMRHLLARTSPTIFGDGEQSRDFTYVEDVAELCWKASQVPGVAGNMYNAGNGGCYTLNQIWQMLQDMEGVALPGIYGPPRAGDVRASMADTIAAKRDLGHAPKYSMEEGLRRTLEWYRHSL